MAVKQQEQENKTVSLSYSSDTDIIRYLKKLNKPFAPYVKELIRRDMNKDILDLEFKENLKSSMVELLKEALMEASPNKKQKYILNQINELRNMLLEEEENAEEDITDLYRNDPSGNGNEIGFKVVETKNDEAVVIESPNKIEEKSIDDDEKEALAALLNMKNKG